MKLENQVVCLDLAKKLKELGVTQESVFSHIKFIDESGENRQEIYTTRQWEDEYAAEEIDRCSAFTVAELGAMLPHEIVLSKTDEVFLVSVKDKTDWLIWYEGLDENGLEYKWESFTADTEADARAKMLIYLLENELITLSVS